MPRKASISGPVEKYFRTNPNVTVSMTMLKRETGIGNAQAISAAITYLRKRTNNPMDIQTVERGKQWRFNKLEPIAKPKPKAEPEPKPKKAASEPKPVLRKATTMRYPQHVVDAAADIGTRAHERLEAFNRMVDKLGPAEQTEMAKEPDGTFTIVGSLVHNTEFHGTVVRITSPGWADRPYLITEL